MAIGPASFQPLFPIQTGTSVQRFGAQGTDFVGKPLLEFPKPRPPKPPEKPKETVEERGTAPGGTGALGAPEARPGAVAPTGGPVLSTYTNSRSTGGGNAPSFPGSLFDQRA